MVSSTPHCPFTASSLDEPSLARSSPGIQVSAERNTSAAAKHLFQLIHLIDVNGQPKIKHLQASLVTRTPRRKLLLEGYISSRRPSISRSSLDARFSGFALWLTSILVQCTSGNDAIHLPPWLLTAHYTARCNKLCLTPSRRLVRRRTLPSER
jgi:hypothetical protein